ncbi:DUF2249 domain-containing protein [Sulfobacillus harzensis]|uniref:DUF2249 domain-containing protein n=1 Tax=Sulfobacillus harzensis TaxID=2729629 RepID=A0A7Y0L7B9_9FIRM|nr:DUF2249 domain-containing protein [Sulfobacillus harzensis]NMP23259.1 DUF2249 domain-containing protein [Sulfobacillus harzensis]
MKELDVRPILEAGGEPFDKIMAFVTELAPGEAFRLWATFKPEPLLAVLAQRGYRGTAREMADGSWAVDFVPQD